MTGPLPLGRPRSTSLSEAYDETHREPLAEGETQGVIAGTPWIFSSEIGSLEGTFSPGDIVEGPRSERRFVCLGYLNPESTITVRVLSREDRDIDEEFFRERVRQAVEYRRFLLALRVPFGRWSGSGWSTRKATFLPGLVVDIFAGYVSFQTLTLGIDRWKETLIDAINEYVSPKGIYERNDGRQRLEGMNPSGRVSGRTFDPVIEMDENGVTVLVDIQRGQKTGYFVTSRRTGCSPGSTSREGPSSMLSLTGRIWALCPRGRGFERALHGCQ